MKRRNAASDKRRRKMITILWTAVLAIGTIILIYKEMTAVLYIVATLGVTVLLVLVAMADLSPAEKLTNDPRRSDAASDKRRRKMITILWTAVLAIGTIVLIYKEMTAVLYILATFGITALLAIVGMADLSPAEKLTNDPRRSDDAAAIGSGTTSTFGAKPS